MSNRFTAKQTLNIDIIDDSFTDYLNKLEELLQTEKKELANTLLRKMVGYYGQTEGGYIAPLMSKYNPYLYSTGQNESYWAGKSEEGLTTLEALYTGMDINKYGDAPKGVWWEFATEATKNLPPKWRRIKRDYAYFQETGIDPIAKPEQAENQGAIERGIEASTGELYSQTQEYLNQLLQLKHGLHISTGNRSVNDMFK